MRPLVLTKAISLKGRISLPGDKSIAHRSVIFSSLSSSKIAIDNFPLNKDCKYTIEALKKLGVDIRLEGVSPSSGNCRVVVKARGLNGLVKPAGPLFLGDSGTTARLLLGLLAGQDFTVRLSAAIGLSRRPMLRVTGPLRLMGAWIKAKPISGSKDESFPVEVRGRKLDQLFYKMPVASAQVKSAIILAGLYARGITTVVEPVKTRDHTERMLRLFNADIKVSGNRIRIRGGCKLKAPRRIYIPGDISSAAFFIVGATLLAGSRLVIQRCSLNPSRAGILRVLKRMGANINIERLKNKQDNFEPVGDITVISSRLKGVRVTRGEIPSLIDELPVLMVAACFAQGKTVFEGVDELRVKETDRIKSMTLNLVKMGARINVQSTRRGECVFIEGVGSLSAVPVKSFSDHRTAMSLIIAALNTQGQTRLDDIDCISKSFPQFLPMLKKTIVGPSFAIGSCG